MRAFFAFFGSFKTKFRSLELEYKILLTKFIYIYDLRPNHKVVNCRFLGQFQF